MNYARHDCCSEVVALVIMKGGGGANKVFGFKSYVSHNTLSMQKVARKHLCELTFQGKI